MRQIIKRAHDDSRPPVSDEAALAAEFLEIQTERELDRFLPLLIPALKLAAPLVAKVAGPLLKTMAGKLLGGGGSSGRRGKRSDSQPQQDEFLGKVVSGLLNGESETESEEEEQFLGSVLSKLMGESELEDEQEEQFIDTVLGGLFGGNRTAHERLAAGLVSQLFNGEQEQEGESGSRPDCGPAQAQRFIQLAHSASRQAGTQIAARLRGGRVPSERELREIVLRAFVKTAPTVAPQRSELMMELESIATDGTGTWRRHGNAIMLDSELPQIASNLPSGSGSYPGLAGGRVTVPRMLAAMARKRYVVYTEPFKLNIIGVRSTSAQPNSFDDTIYVMFKDAAGQWTLKDFPATTEPGTYYLNNPMNVKGTAILVPGQYENSHKLGLHRNSYTALVQQRSLAVYRDADRNDTLDISEDKIDRGLFGINIHRAGTNSSTIDRWSAGCQVFARSADFAEFIQLCQRHKALHGNNFSYSLLLQRDL